MKNILDIISDRIEVRKKEDLHAQLVDIGIRGKKLRAELYETDGAYKDLSIEELQALYNKASELILEWKKFYRDNINVPGLIVTQGGIFTENAMVCNDYIMHANNF